MRHRLIAATLACLLTSACSFDPKVMRERYVKTGNKYFNRGRYKEAAMLYRHALEEDMRYGEAWYRLGLTDMRLHNDAAAREDMNRAVDLDRDNMDAMVKLAEMDVALYTVDPQRFKLLRSEVQELIGRIELKDPDSFDALRLSGYLAMVEGNFKLAVVKFRQANAIRPQDQAVTLALIQVLFANGQPGDALGLSEALITRDKTFAPVYDLLYGVYMKSGQTEKAEEILQRKLRNNPAVGPYWIQLAEYYRVTNRVPAMTAVLERLTGDLKTFPNAPMLVGDYFSQIRDFDRAAGEYSQGLKDDPGEAPLYLRKMATIFMAQGKNAEAAKVVDALVTLEPGDAGARGMHVALELPGATRDKAQKIIGELQPMIERQPDNFELHYFLGRAYGIKGDSGSMEEARVQYEEALRLNPEYVPARLALLRIEVGRGEYSKAATTAQQVLATDPGNLEARLSNATALAQMGDTDHARQELQIAVEGNPGSRDARYQLATLDYGQRDFRGAEAEFQALRTLGDWRGVTGLADCWMEEGNTQAAIRILYDALQRDPGRDAYMAGLARAAFKAGQYADAARAYQVLVTREPKNAGYYIELGRAKWNMNDTQGALAAFQSAQKASPGDPTAFLTLASLQAQAGNNQEARKAYQEALKLQPDNPVALSRVAYLNAQDGVDLDQAFAFAQDARVKLPNDPDVLDTLALIYLKKNLVDDGMHVLQDLVKRDPERAVFHLHYAMALYQNGDTDRARAELQTALRSNPSALERNEITRLMARIG